MTTPPCTCYGPPLPSHWDRCPAAPWSAERRAMIDQAVQEITRTVGNETLAWNLWNNLNTSEAFVAAFRALHPDTHD